ncbi:MAG: hypothetical protein EZS28_027157 [Streblomastix strix]|uniref:Uncharacterized protein n=1 Tax=Streblomastix strix TaxID=222440 RepID=A0A5J4V5B7_9EUKA|nr:MAG: hypothetical protein EZS28_027157 [Streblomastix strix]
MPTVDDTINLKEQQEVRYGNNQWIPQTIYIMIEKRNNGHIEETIKQYTQQMKELSDSISHYPIRNFTDIIRGVKTFLQPIIAGKIVKQGGTNNQILLANRDTTDKDQLDYEPIENARYSSIAYGMYESRAWGTLTTQNSRVYISLQITHSNPYTLWQSGYTLFSIVDNAIKPKFTGTPSNIPLNAVLFAQKIYGYPIDWTGAIPIDCHIDLDGHVIINTMCQLSLPDDFCVQVCDSYAIHNQSAN